MRISTTARILLAALLTFLVVSAVLVYRAWDSLKDTEQSTVAENIVVNEVQQSLQLANFIHQLNASAAAYNDKPSEELWKQCGRNLDSVQSYFVILAHSGTIGETDSTVIAFLKAANRWLVVNRYRPGRFAHAFTPADNIVGTGQQFAGLKDTLWNLTAALVTEQAHTIEALHNIEEKDARRDFRSFLWIVGLALIAFLIFLERIRVLFNRRSEEAKNQEGAKQLLEARIAERTKALQDGNALFSTINELTSEVIWDWQIKEGKLWWNRNFYKLLGYTEIDIPLGSEKWLDAIHPDDKLRVQKSYEAALESNIDRWEEEFRCVTATGEVMYFYDRGSIYRDEQGKPVRIVGAMLNITPLRKAFESADMERQLSNTLIDSLPGIFALYNKNNKLIRWNKEVLRVGGYSAAELAGSHPLQFFDSTQKVKLEAAMKLVMEAGENDMETDLIVKDGTRIPYFFRGKVLQIAGEPYFISIGIDISARKKIELDLTTSEQKYRLLFYNSPMPMFMLSLPSLDIIDVNDAAVRHYGYSRMELLSLNAMDLRPKEELPRFKKDVVNHSFEGTTHMGKWVHLKKSGEKIIVDLTAHDLKLNGEEQRLILINDITEQEKAQEALVASEKRLRDTMDNMLEGAQIISFDWRFLYLNHEAVRQSRTTYENLIGQKAFDKYPTVDGTELSRRMEKCMRMREPQFFEDEFFYPNGGSAWFEFHIQPVPEGIFILSIDRTDRVLAERQIRRAENFNHGVINALSTHLAVINHVGEILLVNDAWRKFGEANGGHMLWNAGIGGNYLQVLEKSAEAGDLDAPVALDGIKGVLYGEENFFYQEYPCHGDEEERWFAMRVVRFDADEAMAVIMHEDITTRKLHLREIQSSHERLRRLTDGVPMAIYQFEMTEDGEIGFGFMSRYAENILPGVTAESAMEDAASAFRHIHADDLDEVWNSIEKSRRALTPWRAIFRVTDESGAIRWIEGNSTPRMNKDKVVIWVGYLQDVTERIKSELAIKELNESLEQKVAQRTAELVEVNKSLEDFSYSVSHDLRGPLRSILGFLDIMKQDYGPRLDDDLRMLVNYAEGSGKRMNAIIDDLLILAKYGKDRLRLTNVNVEDMVHEVWGNLCKEGSVKAVLELQSIPRVSADASMLRQVFINLLGNAIKYSARKESPVVRVMAAERDGQVSITVQDNGAGFDMKYYERLFIPFQRLHGITEFEGTGVGLVLVKKIIEKHGGRVWAEGKVNEGASFSFTLDKA